MMTGANMKKATPKKKKIASLDKRKARAGWFFVAPFLIGFILLYLPIVIESIVYSFQRIHTIQGGGFYTEWVGWANYQEALFVNPDFVSTLLKGLQSMAFDIPMIILFSLFMAVLLNQKMVGRAAFRAIFFIPVILSTGLMEGIEASNILSEYMESAEGIEDGSGQNSAADIVSAIDVERLFAAQFVHLAEKIERHAGGAAEKDADARIYLLGRSVGSAQDAQIAFRGARPPEIYLVPDFYIRKLVAVAGHHRFDETRIFGQMVPDGIGPFGRTIHDRQKGKARCFHLGDDPVVTGEIERSVRRLLDVLPLQSESYALDAGGGDPLALFDALGTVRQPQQMGIDAIRRTCRSLRRRTRRRHGPAAKRNECGDTENRSEIMHMIELYCIFRRQPIQLSV